MMKMMYLSNAQEARLRDLRNALDRYVAKIANVPAEINASMAAIRPWRAGTEEEPVTYTANVDVRMQGGVPYTCAQTHTHRGEPSYEPSPESAIWKETHGTTPDTARPFVTRGDNPYMQGEYCTQDGVVYRCKRDFVTYAPADYPDAWEKTE